MAEKEKDNTNNQGKKPEGKDKKPKFNTNWIFAIAFLGLIIINLLFGAGGLQNLRNGVMLRG